MWDEFNLVRLIAVILHSVQGRPPQCYKIKKFLFDQKFPQIFTNNFRKFAQIFRSENFRKFYAEIFQKFSLRKFSKQLRKFLQFFAKNCGNFSKWKFSGNFRLLKFPDDYIYDRLNQSYNTLKNNVKNIIFYSPEYKVLNSLYLYSHIKL